MSRHFEDGRDRRFRRGFGRGEGEEGFMGRSGRHWHGGRDRERPLDHGALRLVMLVMISAWPRHGYELIREIEERFGGSYTPSPGVVYPTLTMLEELGHATVEEKGGKKLYSITEEGKAYLAVNRAATDAAMARMNQMGSAYKAGRSPQLMRALENLKMALRLRQQRGPLTEEQLRSIVTAIDAAATSIERS